MSITVTILIFAIIAAFLVAVIAVVWFLRNEVSRWVDRYKIRPSLVAAVFLIVSGIILLLSAFILPISVIPLAVFYAFLGSMAMASAIEKLVVPAQVEHRPLWYEGKDDPSGDKWPTDAGEKRPHKFSLRRMGLVVSMLCVSMGVLSIKYRWERQQAISHQRAVAKIVELGGTVQQGDVSLAGTMVRDDDLLLLADLARITGLNLGSTGITNGGLKHLVKLQGIRVLTLSGTSVDDDGLAHVGKLPMLASVSLRQTNVTGSGVMFNTKAPLQMLDMSLCPITREGLGKIAQQRCRILSLAETGVNDGMLAELKSIDVQNLDLTGTNVSQAVLAELQAHRPQLQLRGSWSVIKRKPAE